VVVHPDLFLLVHVAYAVAVVGLPLAALVALPWTWRRSDGSTRALLAALALGPAALGVWGTFVEPFRLVDERVVVPVDPSRAPLEPLRVAVLADIQSAEVDAHLREAVRRALAFEPHLVLLPGDLVQRRLGGEVVDEEAFRALLRPLWAPLGVFATLGNCDEPERVRRICRGTNVVVLEDEVVERSFAGRRVLVGGAAADPRGARAFVEAFDTRAADELRILAAHFPDVVLGLDAEPGIDLVVSGHTHGGQVRIPLLGPPLTLSAVPRRVAAGGLHTIDGRLLYVSRGVGCERAAAPRLRLFCPPEVSLLSLEARR
jgi:predicted MPP superfamily phosphohydrolase